GGNPILLVSRESGPWDIGWRPPCCGFRGPGHPTAGSIEWARRGGGPDGQGRTAIRGARRGTAPCWGRDGGFLRAAGLVGGRPDRLFPHAAAETKFGVSWSDRPRPRKSLEAGARPRARGRHGRHNP